MGNCSAAAEDFPGEGQNGAGAAVPFGDAVETEAGGGGVGAYAIKMIVTAHNGNIEVYKSNPGKGTEILLELPKKS